MSNTRYDKRLMFFGELKALCIKYKAEISADDHYPGYPESGEDIRMVVDFEDGWWHDDLDLKQHFS